jgi:hypothetical protein
MPMRYREEVIAGRRMARAAKEQGEGFRYTLRDWVQVAGALDTCLLEVAPARRCRFREPSNMRYYLRNRFSRLGYAFEL